MSTRLSKSRYQKGLQCEKALWLAVHRPNLADPVDEAKEWVFRQGTEVGRLAHGLFPGGVEVTEDHLHSQEALATTSRLLAEGARVLYEPAFLFDDVFVRVDMLVGSDDGSWDLYEVKSSSQVKDEHLTDVAVQTYVVEGCGLAVRTASIVHLDTAYVYEGGDYDAGRLFTIEDVTDATRSYIGEIPAQVERFREVLSAPEPEVRPSSRCRNPYRCDFQGYCRAFLPAEHPITDLPRLSDTALSALLDLGITCIRDVPAVCPQLTETQRKTAAVVKRGEPYVDVEGLRRDLSGLEWPVYHLDFETVNPALPLWPGTRPYEVVPFQYSIHVHYEDGTYEQRGYLAPGDRDPRRALAERMLADLGDSGSIAHYTSYEVRRIDDLSSALPDLAEELTAVRNRLFDLERVIGARTMHPACCGRTSIKIVLPAWCPDLTYADLDIQDGEVAGIRFTKAVRGLMEPDEAQATFAALAEYCGRDTLAMVRLLEVLRELAE